jgi:FkbM family methyltransferase
MSRLRLWIGNFALHSFLPVRFLRRIPIIGRLIHRLSYALLPKGERIWMRIKRGPAEGLWVEVNPRTGREYVYGLTEDAVQIAVSKSLSPGMIVYDIGANIGLFSMLAARLVGASGKVFSFEPDPENAARLRRNIEKNRFDNVSVRNVGVWSSSGSFNFIPADSGSPDHGTGRFNPISQSGVLTSCTSLDDFAKVAPPPDLIKCDVEGAEVEVLRGATGVFQSGRPILICEIHSPENDHAARELLDRLGYVCTNVDSQHILAFVSE